MAADAQMMSHFYSPLHHMWGSSLHPRGYPPADPKYQQYPEQKYPVGEQGLDPRYPGDPALPPAHPAAPPEQKHQLAPPSPSSPAGPPPLDPAYAPPPLLPPHDASHRYMTPPGQLSPQELKHEAGGGEEKDAVEGQEQDRGAEEKVEGGGYGGHGQEYNGYYQQPDLGHPGYGGYSTAGPFPLSSPLARPRSSKAKSQSGNLLPCPRIALLAVPPRKSPLDP
jgi:hypothetical protein